MLARLPEISRRIVCVCLCSCLVLLAASPVVAEDSTEAHDARPFIELELKHAETCYWFGMAEQGNMAAFRQGLRHLENAHRRVAEAAFSADEAQRYAARAAGLRTDLVEQIEIAHDTLYGVFPLTRFLARSIFADSISLRTFEVIDDPTVMAATAAAKNLALVTIEQWRQRHQLDVVFTSTPSNPQLENESLYVFNSHPKFFVHNLREVTDALSPSELAEFQQGRVTPEIRQSLLAAFGIHDLLVVTVQETDVNDGDYFYILTGAIYNSQQEQATHNFAVMGFSRDRNAQFWPIILTNLLLLVLTYLAFWVHARARRKVAVRTGRSALVLVPLLVFAIGRCSPWFFAPILSRIAPIPETLAIVSFWVPAMAGAVLTVVPMAMTWLAAQRLAKLWPAFRIEGRALPVFLGVGAGAVGYAAVPLLLFLEHNALVVLIPWAIGVAGLAALMGRGLDRGERGGMAEVLVPTGLSLLMGVALFQALAGWTAGAGALVVFAWALPSLLEWQRGRGLSARWPHAQAATAAAAREMGDDSGGADRQASGAVNPVRLGELAEHPRFQIRPVHERCQQHLAPLLEGRTVHLALHGSGGCGLTRSATELVQQIVEELVGRGRQSATMLGDCSQPAGEPTPYAPFQKALAQHFEVELLATPATTSHEVDAALGEVFQSIVPFAGILFPASAGVSTATSSEEIIASITWMLRRLARKKSILLLIDDVQWTDDASRTLLQRLIREFPAGGDVPIAIIATSHIQAACSDLGFAQADQVDLGYPTADEQVELLVAGVGLTKPTAEQIVSRMGTATLASGGLFWLLQIVANLARGNAFVETPAGIALAGGNWPTGMFVPNAMRDDLTEKLRMHPQYRQIIESAACACFGREFRASIVARAIGRPLLELLADLDTIDRETSILYDVRARDDVFAFQSSFMLDVVREELRIAEHGPASDESPQIIREHHARLGEVWETLQEADGQQRYQIANHYYAAGARHAERGLSYCLEAARAAAGMFNFEAAERFVDRARECGQVIGKAALVEADRLQIACQKAHLTGQPEDHARVAEDGARYLQDHPDASSQLLLAIAQAHYDAGKSSGDAAWFERSLEIGRRMIEQATSVYEEALGRHFVGISLPPEDRELRKTELRQALALMQAEVEQSAEPTTVDLALLGRILGSLAELLSFGSDDEAREAKTLFERRLQIYTTYRVGDAPGLAKTHGGLGRLALFGRPPDIASARAHFLKDLEISAAIGDVQGETQMHSLLAACALKEGDLATATQQYQRSWDLSRHLVNQVFAGAGLLNCNAQSGRFDAFQAMACRLLELTEAGGVPRACAETLAESLRGCPPEQSTDDVRQLLALALAAGG